MKSESQELTINSIVRGLVIVAIGLAVTVVLALFFGGFSFWVYPGVLVMFFGVVDILSKAYDALISKRSKLLSAGLTTFFFGLASYLSFMTHVMLALLQTISLLVMIIGFIVLVKAMFFSPARS